MSGLRSTSTTTVGAGISIKLELQRKPKEVEMRRTRGDFSYDELVSVVNHMWGSAAPKRLSIEYVDDEGDRVRVGSDSEWAEALAQFGASGAPSLRLYVRRATQKNNSRAAEASSDDEETRAASAPETVANAVPQQQESAEPAVAVETADDSQAAVVKLLSKLYDCDAGREMMNMFSKVDFAPVVRRRLDAVAGEVLVDIDNIALRHLTISRTNAWIGQSLCEKAESALNAALAVWPGDQVLEYNAACASALRGASENALTMLESAIRHGFKDVQQLVTDVDLSSIRPTAWFKRLLDMASSPSTAAAPTATAPAEPVVATAVPAAPAATPVATAAAPTEKWDPVAALMAMFPQLSAEAAARVLKRNGGDLGRAASSLL